MVESTSQDVVTLGAASVLLVAKVISIHASDDGLVSGAARHSSGLHARGWGAIGHTCAIRQGSLRWCSALQAARLAPTSNARNLAILCGVLACCGVAIRATSADANRTAHTAVELVMVESTSQDVVTLGATSVLLVAKVISIHASDDGLVSGAARHSSRLHARGWGAIGHTCAIRQGSLRWCSALKAARLAPTSDARDLAILCSVLTCCGVAIRATSADANRTAHTAVELVMVESTSQDVVTLGAASVLLVAKVISIHASDDGLVIRTA